MKFNSIVYALTAFQLITHFIACNTHETTEQPTTNTKSDTAIILPSADTTKITGRGLSVPMQAASTQRATNVIIKSSSAEVDFREVTTDNGFTQTFDLNVNRATLGIKNLPLQFKGISDTLKDLSKRIGTSTPTIPSSIFTELRTKSDSLSRQSRQIDTLKRTISDLSTKLSNISNQQAQQPYLTKFKVVSSNEIRFWTNKGDSIPIMFETKP